MTPEQRSRKLIDQQLDACGWIVQDYRQMNISAGLGVAIRQFSLSSGEADYLLYADCRAIGVLEDLYMLPNRLAGLASLRATILRQVND